MQVILLLRRFSARLIYQFQLELFYSARYKGSTKRQFVFSSAPHNILYKLSWKTADLKLMPMVWKPKQCENTNFKEKFLRGNKHLIQIAAEIKNFVSLAVEKKLS